MTLLQDMSGCLVEATGHAGGREDTEHPVSTCCVCVHGGMVTTHACVGVVKI